MVMKNVTKKIQKIPYLFLLMLFSFVTASAQKGITVRERFLTVMVRQSLEPQ